MSGSKKRAVVACDQYTSQPEYRKQVQDFVGQYPWRRRNTTIIHQRREYMIHTSDYGQKRIFPDSYCRLSTSKKDILYVKIRREEILSRMQKDQVKHLFIRR